MEDWCSPNGLRGGFACLNGDIILTNTHQAGAGREEHEEITRFDGQVAGISYHSTRLSTYSTTLIRLQPGKLDLLCLPEMALTGYAFPSAEAIKPYLEQPLIGPTSRCCSSLAKRLGCHVIAGYPEMLDASEPQSSEPAVGFNSAIIYGPDGHWRGGYRKTNLFFTDMTWARKGAGLGFFDLGDPLGRISVGICMDLNPFPPAIWNFQEGPYELASFAIDSDTRLVIILCAWLDSKAHPEEQWDRQTVDYWLSRLLPLWRRINDQHLERETIVVICNRAGADGDTIFAGTSTVLRLSQKQDAPEILGLMRRDEEGVKVLEV